MEQSKEIIEGNRLIAEFMGFIFLDNGTINVRSKVRVYLTNWSELKFHISWEWLYPVLRKIEFEAIQQGVVSSLPQISPSSYGIEVIYKYCLDFIKWYNSQPVKPL